MKKNVLIAALATMGLSSAALAEVSVIPRVSLGMAAYSLDIPTVNGPQNAATSSYGTLGAGLTIAADNVYVAIDTTSSGSAEHDLYDTKGGDFSRDDTAFTLGITLDEGFSIFGGVKTGKTEFRTPTLARVKLTTFDSSGYFLGMGISSTTGESALSFNFAVAVLEATLKDNDTVLAQRYDAKSDSTLGFSMGLNWSTALSKQTRLSLGGKYEFYSYADWKNFNTLVIRDMNESIFSMNLGLSHRF